MASKSSTISLQDRDRRLLADLLQSPYDARQLWRLSQTYDEPFTDVHFVRRRLRRLTEAGLVATYHYLTDTPGRLNYYRLAERGYALVCGADKALPSRSQFRAVSPSRQRHVRALAELLATIRVAATPRAPRPSPRSVPRRTGAPPLR